MNKRLVTFILLAVIMLTAVTGLNMKQAVANDALYGVKDVTGVVSTDVLSFANEYLSGIDADIAVYSPDEKVDVIIELGSEKESLLALSKNASAESIAAYIASKDGEKSIKTIAEKQAYFKNAVEKLGIEITYKYSYSAIVNGFAATVRYGDIEKLQAIAGVSEVAITEYYAVPDTQNSATQMNISVAREETGYTGSGMAIAIIDTGVEYTHEAFSVDPEEQKITKDNIAEIIASTAAYNGFSLFIYDEEYTEDYANKELTADDVYKSGKIPFYFDYTVASGAGKPSQDHGTHVAGIAAGNNGNSFTGAAYDAQVLAFNVFGSQGGASTIDILAALNDAVLMGVDAINLSLGTTSGYKFTEYPDKYYKMAEDAGIIVSVSSGNSYWAGYYGNNGNYPSVENMDYGVVGTPGAFDNVFTVGSYNAYEFDEAWFYINGEKYDYSNPTGHKFDEEMTEGIESGVFEGELAYIPLVVISPPFMMTRLARDNWSKADVKGKVVVLDYNTAYTMVEPVSTRIGQAKKQGAIGVIFNLLNTTSLSLVADDVELPVPVAISNSDDFWAIREAAREEYTIKINRGDIINHPVDVSDFSSRGATQDLKLKPDILATGSPVYSSVLGNSYGLMSGTSMAAPNITGITAIVKQYVNEMFPDMSATEKAATVMRIIMSTATVVSDKYGVSVSPRTQGAGLANVLNAVTTKSYIMVDGLDKAKIEFGDDPEMTGVYTLKFKVVNFSDSSKAYVLDMDTITEGYSGKYTTGYAYELSPNFTYKATGGGAITENGTLLVEANGVAEVTVTLTLSDEDREYLKAFPNGCFVEGFIKLLADNEGGIDLNVPFMGYYGDWYELPLLDKTIYDGDEEILLSGALYGKNGYTLGKIPYTVADGYEVDEGHWDRIYISTTGRSKLYAYYLGALRNLYSVNYKLSDYDTGETYFDYTYLWVAKSAPTRTGYINTMGYPYSLDWDNIGQFGDFANGERFIFTVEATLIDDEGKEHKQTIDYTIKVDNTRPVLIEDSAKLVYEDGRLYFTADFYDNEYLAFVYMSNPNTSTGVYRFDGEKGETLNFKVDVTDYYSQLKEDGTITIFVEDYAYNRSTYEVTLPMPEIRTAVPKELNITNSEEDSTLAINEYKEITYDIVPYDFYDVISKEYIVADESIVRAQEDGMLGLASGETQITVIIKIEMYNGVIITLEDTFTVTVSEEVVKKTKGTDLYLTFDDPRYQDYVVGNSHGMLAGFTVFGGGSYLDFNVNPIPWYADDTFSTQVSFTTLSGDGSDYGVGGGLNGLVKTVRVVGNRVYLDGYNARATVNVVLKGGVGVIFYLEVRKPVTADPDGEEFVTYESNGITYLTRYNGTSEVVEIPEGVQIIGDYTFATRTNVKKVILPESCLQISNYAFAECSIEEIVINKELSYIQSYAFYGSKLKSIVMPEDSKLIDVGKYAFYRCEDLKYADFSNVIGDGETEFLLFDYYAFNECTSLEEIKLPTTGYEYTLYPRCFEDCTSLKEVILDDSCIYINSNVFEGCTSLEKVVLPSTLEVIQYGVFAGCTSLKSIEIPESVKRIYYNAFEESGLEEIFIGKNIKSIMYGAFLNCKNLKKIVFEDGFDGFYYNDDDQYYSGGYSMYDCVDIFSGCTSLEEVVLPDSVTRIPDGIFKGCTSLSSINIPEGVTSIGEYAFYNTALSTIELPDTITSIGHYAFAESLLESVEFGNNLSVIGNYAFANTYLTEINIPESMTYIGNYAFSGVNLTISELRFNENLIFLGAYSFDSATIDDIYLPASLEAIDFSMNSTARYHIDENCELVKEIGNGIYANGGNILMFYQGISLEVEIADGTARIHQGAFAKRSSINSLIIPASVKRIGDGVFNFEIGYVRFLGDAPILEYTDKINTFLPGTTIYVNADAKGFDGAEWSDYNIIYLSEGLLLNEKIASVKTDDEIIELYNEFMALSETEKAKVTNAAMLLNKYMEIIAKRDAEALEEARKALEEANENNKNLAEELEESIKANEELQKKYNEVTNMPSCGAQSDISVISIVSFVILAFAVVFLTLKRKNKKD